MKAFLFCIVLFLLSSFISMNAGDAGRNSNKLVVILLNSDDCRNCLRHDYALIDQLLKHYDHPGKVIIALSEKRKEAMENERNELSDLFNIHKASLVWNNEVISKMRRAANLNPAMSSILIFDCNYHLRYSKAIKMVRSFEELEEELK